MKFEFEGHSRSSGIYVILNSLKDHYYIGQTSRWFAKRWNEHERSLLNTNAKARGQTNKWLKSAFQRGMKREGGNSDFMEFRVLEVVELSNLNRKEKEDKLNEREMKWVSEFKKQGKKLYNLTRGGGFIGNHTEETKKRMSASHKGKVFTKQHKERIGKFKKGRTYEEIYGSEKAKEIREKLRTAHLGHDPWNKGDKCPADHREQMRELHLGAKNPMHRSNRAESHMI